MYAKLILDVKSSQLNRSFDYLVPNELEELVEVGSRAFVQFGHQKKLGIIVELSSESEALNPKPILELLDFEPVISSELLDIAKAMSKKYFSFLIENLFIMIPNALKAKYQKKIRLVDKNVDDEVLALFKNKDEIDLDSFNLHKSLLAKLKKENKILIETYFKQKGSIKTEKVVYLLESPKLATPKQKEIIAYLEENGMSASYNMLVKEMGYSTSSIKTLEKNGAIKICEEELYRELNKKDYKDKNITLNSEQEECFKEIKANLNSYNEYLIHGVCGSGKTEIYLNLIEECLKQNKTALMLVPEIALTPQMSERFNARFKDKVAIIHSRLSIGEKYDQWRKIKRGETPIVVGARSALFSPLKDIGIIIMDEEQESSYIQDSNPRYDSHFVAKLRAIHHSCPLVYGSATPLVKTYYEALNGNIKLLELKKRANNTMIKPSFIADMRYELRCGNKSVFSKELRSSLINTLSKGEQAVLLINRRGYSTFVMCRSCGEVIKCPHCDVSLTYHRYDNSLTCHYCGHKESSPTKCPNCDSSYIRFVGDGTQKVEEELKALLPEVRILRMDSDTTKAKNAHEDIIDRFSRHEADVLLGTQIVAKGLDFPGVSLVGIVNADLGLKLPSYDAKEKTFDLLTQASGRAGRSEISGRTIIQTYNPDDYVIKCASLSDYKTFYENEINYRRLAQNPPFMDLIEIVVTSEDEGYAYKKSVEISNIIRNKTENLKLLGPTKHYIFKKNDMYSYQIMLSLDNDEADEILSFINSFYQKDKKILISITRK